MGGQLKEDGAPSPDPLTSSTKVVTISRDFSSTWAMQPSIPTTFIHPWRQAHDRAPLAASQHVRWSSSIHYHPWAPPKSLEPPSMHAFSFPSIVTPHPRHHIHPLARTELILLLHPKRSASQARSNMKVEAPSVDTLSTTTVPYVTQTKYLTFVWTTNYVMSKTSSSVMWDWHYSVKYCQSHKILLCVWIMLWFKSH